MVTEPSVELVMKASLKSVGERARVHSPQVIRLTSCQVLRGFVTHSPVGPDSATAIYGYLEREGRMALRFVEQQLNKLFHCLYACTARCRLGRTAKDAATTSAERSTCRTHEKGVSTCKLLTGARSVVVAAGEAARVPADVVWEERGMRKRLLRACRRIPSKCGLASLRRHAVDGSVQ